jgi:ATP-dependent exoDNAse (exonuclease V) alpha subunit
LIALSLLRGGMTFQREPVAAMTAIVSEIAMIGNCGGKARERERENYVQKISLCSTLKKETNEREREKKKSLVVNDLTEQVSHDAAAEFEDVGDGERQGIYIILILKVMPFEPQRAHVC